MSRLLWWRRNTEESAREERALEAIRQAHIALEEAASEAERRLRTNGQS